MAMNPLFLLLGSEGALSDRALAKITAQLREEKAELTTLTASDVLVGDIADALAPSLFSERRALIIKDLQDLDDDCKEEITRYLQAIDLTTTVVLSIKAESKVRRCLMQLKKQSPRLFRATLLRKRRRKSSSSKNYFSIAVAKLHLLPSKH